MTFSLSLFERYVGPVTQNQASNAQWNAFSTTINAFANDSRISSFLSSLSSDPKHMFVLRDPDHPLNAAWDEAPRSIFLGDDAVNGSITTDAVDGSDQVQPFSRVIFHELVHAKYSDGRAAGKDALAHEERAVFLENAIYRVSFGGYERMGHNGGSISDQVLYLALPYLQSRIWQVSTSPATQAPLGNRAYSLFRTGQTALRSGMRHMERPSKQM